MSIQIPIDEPLMTYKEVMKYLRVSRSTLGRMIEAGKIVAHKVGNSWRFYESDVRASVRLEKPTEQGETHE